MTMTCCHDYTLKHKIALCAVGLGLAMCLVGCVAPFWMSGKLVDEEFTSHLTHNLPRVDRINGQGETTTYDVSVGLWWYCIGLEGREQMCFDYPPHEQYRGHKVDGFGDDNRDYMILVRTLLCGCVLVALSGLFIICFSCSTCCSNRHTTWYGIAFFVAGLLGFAGVFVLTFKVDVLLAVPESNVTYGWAFPVFLTGNSLIVIASGILCIPSSKSDNLKYETMFTLNIPQHEIVGQMGVYESLPDTCTFSTCQTDI